MKTFDTIIDLLKEESPYFGYLLDNNYIQYSFGNIVIPEGFEFAERNPDTKIEIWKKKKKLIIKSEFVLVSRCDNETSVIFSVNSESNVIYGVLRSELTNLLRNNLTKDTAASVHAACVKINNRVVLIIGDKGSGKSSSSIYLHSKGGEIYTDELVIFHKNGHVFCLPRLLGIDQITLFKYFPDYKRKVKYEIKSMHNIDKKFLLDIMTKPSELTQIDDVILLIQGNIHNVSNQDKISLISRQWSTYDNGVNSGDILKNIISKSKPMTLNQIREKIYE